MAFMNNGSLVSCLRDRLKSGALLLALSLLVSSGGVGYPTKVAAATEPVSPPLMSSDRPTTSSSAAAPSSLEACGQQLLGVWQGSYSYRTSPQTQPESELTPFVLTVDNYSDGVFEGSISEPRMGWGPENLSRLESTVMGFCQPLAGDAGYWINFTKTYTFKGGHSIQYMGPLSGPMVMGQWRFSSGPNGTWQATKR
jgi:hypothetical protein